MASKTSQAKGRVDLEVKDTKFASGIRAAQSALASLDKTNRALGTGATTVKNKLEGLASSAASLKTKIASYGRAWDEVVTKTNNAGRAMDAVAQKSRTLGTAAENLGAKTRRMGGEFNGGAMTKIQNAGRAMDETTRRARTLSGAVTDLGTKTRQMSGAFTQSTQSVRQQGQAMQQTAASARQSAQATTQATQATSRLNAGSIGTAASIGTMGAGLVSLEASMSNYTKAQFKVEKATVGVEKATLNVQRANTMLLNAENMLRKGRESGKKTAAELQYYEEQVANYREDARLKTEDLTLKQERLNIAQMDYADTQKLMASSIATTLLGTVSAAAQMISAKSVATAKDTAATKGNMISNLANSKALRILGIDLTAARTHFSTASMAVRGFTISSTGARVAVTGFSKATLFASATLKGLWASLGPVGLITILATGLYTAWETSQEFRDGIMWLIDSLQELWKTLRTIIPVFGLVEDGLKAMGWDIAANTDAWQEANRTINQGGDIMLETSQSLHVLDTEMEHANLTTDDLSESVDNLTGHIEDTTESFTSAAGILTSSLIPAFTRYDDIIRTAIGTETDSTKIKRDMQSSLIDLSNAFRTAGENGQAAMYAMQQSSGSATMRMIEDWHNSGFALDDWHRKLWDMAGGSEEAWNKLAGGASNATSSIISDISDVSQATEQLKRTLSDLKKNHFEPGFRYMSSSLDTLREGLRALHEGEYETSKAALEKRALDLRRDTDSNQKGMSDDRNPAKPGTYEWYANKYPGLSKGGIHQRMRNVQKQAAARRVDDYNQYVRIFGRPPPGLTLVRKKNIQQTSTHADVGLTDWNPPRGWSAKTRARNYQIRLDKLLADMRAVIRASGADPDSGYYARKYSKGKYTYFRGTSDRSYRTRLEAIRDSKAAAGARSHLGEYGGPSADILHAEHELSRLRALRSGMGSGTNRDRVDEQIRDAERRIAGLRNAAADANDDPLIIMETVSP